MAVRWMNVQYHEIQSFWSCKHRANSARAIAPNQGSVCGISGSGGVRDICGASLDMGELGVVCWEWEHRGLLGAVVRSIKSVAGVLQQDGRLHCSNIIQIKAAVATVTHSSIHRASLRVGWQYTGWFHFCPPWKYSSKQGWGPCCTVIVMSS